MTTTDTHSAGLIDSSVDDLDSIQTIEAGLDKVLPQSTQGGGEEHIKFGRSEEEKTKNDEKGISGDSFSGIKNEDEDDGSGDSQLF